MAAKVLLISPYGDEIAGRFNEADEVTWKLEPVIEAGYDWVVCYGCRKMIREPWLTIYRHRMINIHISYLPFNRGADPNFWSWLDNTPKGITVHEIDEGMDTGPIIDRAAITFKAPEKHTLKTSYETLRSAVPFHFETVWKRLVRGDMESFPQPNISFSRTHKSADKDPWMNLLPLKWDTPVEVVSRMREEME